jgi:hypothetical protein
VYARSEVGSVIITYPNTNNSDNSSVTACQQKLYFLIDSNLLTQSDRNQTPDRYDKANGQDLGPNSEQQHRKAVQSLLEVQKSNRNLIPVFRFWKSFLYEEDFDFYILEVHWPLF